MAAGQNGQRCHALAWAILFFALAIFSALFGFGLIATAAAGIAQVLFVVFFVLFIVALVADGARRRSRGA